MRNNDRRIVDFIRPNIVKQFFSQSFSYYTKRGFNTISKKKEKKKKKSRTILMLSANVRCLLVEYSMGRRGFVAIRANIVLGLACITFFIFLLRSAHTRVPVITDLDIDVTLGRPQIHYRRRSLVGPKID